MFDHRLEDRLRTVLRQTGDALSLSVTGAELERRLTVRRRTRTVQRSTLIAAAVGILAVGAVVGSAPSWLRQTPNQIATTASPPPSASDSASPSVPPVSPKATAPVTPTSEPAADVTVIRYLDYNGHAFEIAVDGTGRRAVPDFDLVPELGIDPDAPWVKDKSASPDGRLTVMVSSNGSRLPSHARLEVRIRSIDASASDTTVSLPLSNVAGEGRFSWSPDGRYLAVWSGLNGTFNTHTMWVLDVTDGQTTAGPIDLTGRIEPTWSPDSARIAMGGREGLVIATAATGETKMLRMGADVTAYWDLRWAPDGRSLIFSPATAAYEIHRLNADATGRKLLALGTGGQWSRDGSRIAYLRRSADQVGPSWHFEIWTMRPDGSDKRALVTKPCPCSGLKWSPDGGSLMFIASHGEHDDVWVVGADGKDARRLARDANIVQWITPGLGS